MLYAVGLFINLQRDNFLIFLGMMMKNEEEDENIAIYENRRYEREGAQLNTKMQFYLINKSLNKG